MSAERPGEWKKRCAMGYLMVEERILRYMREDVDVEDVIVQIVDVSRLYTWLERGRS